MLISFSFHCNSVHTLGQACNCPLVCTNDTRRRQFVVMSSVKSHVRVAEVWNEVSKITTLSPHFSMFLIHDQLLCQFIYVRNWCTWLFGSPTLAFCATTGIDKPACWNRKEHRPWLGGYTLSDSVDHSAGSSHLNCVKEDGAMVKFYHCVLINSKTSMCTC